MTKPEILAEIQKIFRDQLNDNGITLYDATTANDIEAWDSLTHIQLISAVEKHFKIRFRSIEIRSFRNVGELCDTTLMKIAAK